MAKKLKIKKKPVSHYKDGGHEKIGYTKDGKARRAETKADQKKQGINHYYYGQEKYSDEDLSYRLRRRNKIKKYNKENPKGSKKSGLEHLKGIHERNAIQNIEKGYQEPAVKRDIKAMKARRKYEALLKKKGKK